MERDSRVAESLIDAARQLSARLSTLTVAPPVSHLYNPLTYAWAVHERYLRRYAASTRRVVFLGMNPGPGGVPGHESGPIRDGANRRAVR